MATRTKPSSPRARVAIFVSGATLLVLVGVIAFVASGFLDRGTQDESEPAATADSPADPPVAALKDTGNLPVTRPSWNELDNPADDGWETEVLSSRATAQLKKLGKLLTHPAEITPEAVAPLLDADFSSRPLLPAELHAVYRDGPLLVQRGSVADSALARRFRGGGGMAAALRELARPFADATDMRFKFKLFRVQQTGGRMTTRQYFNLTGRTKVLMREQNATWNIDWTIASADGVPRIRSIEVTDFEQVTRGSPRWFSDCTESVLSPATCYKRQLLRGYGHWLERIPHGIYLELMGSPGVAIGDVNGDGLEDLYLCQERGLPNRLFLQQSDGTVRDVSAAWGVDWLESSRAALLVDLDNDGDQDLVVSVMGGVLLASNEAGRRFEFRRLLRTTEDVTSLAAADYDEDGDVDLYVCAYYRDKRLDEHGDAGGSALPTGDAGFVMHNATTGGANQLLRNDIRTAPDEWQFTDVTAALGLDGDNHRLTFAACWEDYDNDGDQDLYVVNEFGPDNFYRNDGDRFVDVSQQAHVEYAGSGMGITWGDYDRDGYMDAHISNMFSAAGNRVTFQDNFKADAPAEVKRRIQRLARGNTLLQNAGNGTFRDRSAAAGVEIGRWAWASRFADLNNDGWEDLLVANGYITADDTGDL